jgi:NAD-dependent DNA ligase
VSGSVDYLIVADEKPGKGKLDAARRLNIPLVSEEEFMAL